jgi:hypothetical protein
LGLAPEKPENSESYFYVSPGAGLPDFSWYNIPKRGKTYQITIKYSKWPQNILTGSKIEQMAVK